MRDAIRQFVQTHTKEKAYTDYLPDVKSFPNATGVFCYSDIPQGDGSSWQRYQIQVRRKTYQHALEDSALLYRLLDSGEDEESVRLTDDVSCFIRQRNGPKLLDRGSDYTTFYFEISVFKDG